MKIYTVGGFNEVGKNMTVVDLGDDAIIFDAGLYLPAVIELQEEEMQPESYSEKKLRSIGALPDDDALDKIGLRNKARAILLGHAHLDHIGAIPYIGYRYKNAPVVGTPFTLAVLKKIMQDDKIKIPNKMVTVNPNSSFIIKGKKRDYQAEFINITHSTLQTSMIALHTPEGVVLYANDFKLDNTPVMGLPPNYEALKRIAKKGVKVLIVDSLYSGANKKTPSEKVARALVEEVLMTVENSKSSIFVATFSSHIARIKSIVDYGKKLNRKIYVIGRSMSKYIGAAEEVGMCPFKKDIELGSYKRQVESILKKVSKSRERSLVICTGHQGEPGSILDRLSRNKLPFVLRKNDNIIFASKTIPAPANIANKENLDKRLRKTGVRLFDEVHVSGHGGREDLRDLLSIVKPKNIIPAHGSTQQLTPMIELCRELGYRAGKECHLMQDGQSIKL
ncbi:MAG: RNase J family beta-CASP ribonuclease [archaeon]